MTSKEEFRKLVEEMTVGVNLDDPADCKRAYQHILSVAGEQFQDDLNINQFVAFAAERLGQTRINYSILEHLIEIPEDAQVYLSYTNDGGPELVANEDGLKYLAEVFKALAECEFDGEHIHFRYQEAPLIGRSFPLTIYREGKKWFDWRLTKDNEISSEEGANQEPEIARRKIDAKSIIALCDISAMAFPPTINLTGRKIYRVHSVSEYADGSSWSRVIRDNIDRMYLFEILDDNGKPFNFSYDLDDKDVLFFTNADLLQVTNPGV